MPTKKIVINSLVFGCMAVIPMFASAATLDDLILQIQNQIAALQTQIAQLQSGQEWHDGDRVQAGVTNLRVRTSPSSTAEVKGTVSPNMQGAVKCLQTPCVVKAGGFDWWYIKWDNGLEGWSAYGDSEVIYLVKVSEAIYSANFTTTTTTTTSSVSAGPVISSLSPTSGQIGKIVTINGSGFLTNTTNSPYVNTISFGGTSVRDASSVDGTTLTFTVPSVWPALCIVSPCTSSSGTSVNPGTYKVKVLNKNGNSNEMNFTVTGTAPATVPLSITTASIPGATVGQAYSTSIVATGGSGDYSWKVLSHLPAGLSSNTSGNNSPLVISGTPAMPSSSSITVQVSAGGVSATRTFNIVVSGANSGPLSISTVSLPNAVAGQSYGATISASGGSGFYSWKILGGSLPGSVGYSVQNYAMNIGGTPLNPGTYTFTVQVTSGTAVANRTFTINVLAP